MLSFTVAVKKAEGDDSIAVRQMVLKDVPTHEVRSGKPEGADWIFTNNAKITQDGSTKASDSAEDVYRSSVFEKSVAIDGKRQDYITGDTTVNYDDVKDQKLLYRIRLVTTGTETGNIVITDTMPTGTELTVNGDKLRLYVDNEQCSWNPAERWHVTYDETNKKLTVEVYGATTENNTSLSFCMRSALRTTPVGKTCSHRISPTPTKQNGVVRLWPSRPRCTRILLH